MAQKDLDQRIIKLIQTLDDIYAFVQEAEPTRRIESQKDILKLIVLQTTECAYFIRHYASSKGFGAHLAVSIARASLYISCSSLAARIVTSFLSHADGIIKQYQDKLDELKSAFQDRPA